MTVGEMVAHPQFKKFVAAEVDIYRKAYLNRNYKIKYKRTWVDRFIDTDKLSTDYFLQEIIPIWNKESKLPAEDRKVIVEICRIATINFYNEVLAKDGKGTKVK